MTPIFVLFVVEVFVFKISFTFKLRSVDLICCTSGIIASDIFLSIHIEPLFKLNESSFVLFKQLEPLVQ